MIIFKVRERNAGKSAVGPTLRAAGQVAVAAFEVVGQAAAVALELLHHTAALVAHVRWQCNVAAGTVVDNETPPDTGLAGVVGRDHFLPKPCSHLCMQAKGK